MLSAKALGDVRRFMRDRAIGGWLLYNLHGSNPVAQRVAGVESGLLTRRWFYLVPARGRATLLASAVDSAHVKPPRGARKVMYGGRGDLERRLKGLLGGLRNVAMEYSPRAELPQVSLVDAGTVELVRSLGVGVVSSADLVQLVGARLSRVALASHRRAAREVCQIKDGAFALIRRRILAGRRITEYDVMRYIEREYKRRGLVTDATIGRPTVAAGESGVDPHYFPTERRHRAIRRGDLVLVDIWAKEKRKGAVFADITWMGFVGAAVPHKYAKVFDVVRGARDATVRSVRSAREGGRIVRGWQADRVARKHIADRGYARFVHRHTTGHSLGEQAHWRGANLGGLESRDTRELIPGTAFTVEPGVYIPGRFGVRSEIDVYVRKRGIEVTTEAQSEITPLLK